ncbi:hypothetical protein [Flindersiella endophytica]
MQIPLKIATYLVGLAAMFVVAAGIGRVAEPLLSAGPQGHLAMAGPTEDHTSRPTTGPTHSPSAGPTHSRTHQPRPTDGPAPTHPNEPAPAAMPGGLQVAEAGYTLRLTSAAPAVRRAARLTFQIIGPDGRPATAFTARHGKPLHLVVIRRDLTYYRHLHPGLSPDGTWTAVLAFARAGTYRVFADFQPAGRAAPLTLGADLTVPGNQVPRALPSERLVAGLSGYTIQRTGTLTPGRRSRLTFTISRAGRPVTDLEPYLESYGHLVVLRSGDLAYLHVHPEPSSAGRAGPTVTFDTEVPSAGTYRLFLDFRHQGRIRTAEFTVVAR